MKCARRFVACVLVFLMGTANTPLFAANAVVRAVPSVGQPGMTAPIVVVAPLRSLAVGAVRPLIPSGPLSMASAPMPTLRSRPLTSRAAAASAETSPVAAALVIEELTETVGALLNDTRPGESSSLESSRDLTDGLAAALTGSQEQSVGEPAASAPVQQPPAAPKMNVRQRKMIQTLLQVAAILSDEYAPRDDKKDKFSIDLKRETQKARSAILAEPDMKTRRYQELLAEFVAGLRDYHVGIAFHSTERSRLHFSAMGAEGKLYFAHIDREKLPLSVFPFRAGDEIVAFDGQPAVEAVQNIASRMGGGLDKKTNMRLAEIFLTNRRRARGEAQIPEGPVEIKVRRADGKLYRVSMPWDYTPELVAQDVPLRDSGLLELEETASAQSWAEADKSAPEVPVESLGGLAWRALTQAAHPWTHIFSQMSAEAASNPFMIGARKSYIPRLGRVLWQTKPDNPFHAYIFKTPDGRKVGFIRIGTYDGGGAAEVKAFKKIIARFQKETSALVIDQVNNPGGAIFYLYALLSHLTDKLLMIPRHQMIIGEGDAKWAGDLFLKALEEKSKRGKKSVDEDEEWSGYPVTQKFMVLTFRFAEFILKQFQAGKRFTDLFHLWGVDDIDPATEETERYTKPILLLTNSLDFSGGDFFPAILQDNQRALIVGEDTSGAGGAVKQFSLPNQFGIEHLSATWTLARRLNGRTIEDWGVSPDIVLAPTAKDLRSGFSDTRRSILKILNRILDETGSAAP
ncbi:MAG: protease-like activity factor CPAF [Elusimicrobiota bacterium]